MSNIGSPSLRPMSQSRVARFASMIAVLVLMSGAVGGASASTIPSKEEICLAPIPNFSDRCPTWVSEPFAEGVGSYSGEGALHARVIQASPDGRFVFAVASTCLGSCSSSRVMGTVAYDARTGQQLWSDLAEGDYPDVRPQAMVVSDDRLFVTGWSIAPGSRWQSGEYSAVTVAYAQATGERLWTKMLPGDTTKSIAASPDGTVIYVVGSGVRRLDNGDIRTDGFTLALDAATGHEQWRGELRGRPGPAGGTSDPDGSIRASDIAVSSSGDRVFTSAVIQDRVEGDRAMFVAYDTREGETLGQELVRGVSSLAAYSSLVSVVAITPDAKTVIVELAMMVPPPGEVIPKTQAVTLAFDSHTGAGRWTSATNSISGTITAGDALAVSSDGSRVYVSGLSTGGSHASNLEGQRDALHTIAYAVSSGAPIWEDRFPIGGVGGTCFGCGPKVELAPDGRSLYVTGHTNGQYIPGASFFRQPVTVAFDAATGTRQWVATRDAEVSTLGSLGRDWVGGIAVSPDSSKVFIATSPDQPDAEVTTRLEVVAYDA